MSSFRKAPVQFGSFVFDLDKQRLTRLGVLRRLENLSAIALAYLIEHKARVVSRDELIQLLWPNEAHGNFDHRLDKVIAKIRFSLADNANKPKFIETLRGRGFQFIAEVTAASPEQEIIALPSAQEDDFFEEEEVQPLHEVRNRRWSLAFGVLGALGVVSTCVWFVAREWPRKSEPNAQIAAATKRWDEIGMFALRDGTQYKATKAFEQAVAIDPDSPIEHAHLARALLMSDLRERAQAEMLKASDLTRVRHLSKLDQDSIEALRAKLVHDYPRSTAYYKAILDELPESEKASGWEDLGGAYIQEAKLPDAIRCYEEAAKLQPSSAGAQLQLGNLHATLGQMDLAEAYFDRALSLYQASSNEDGVVTVKFSLGLNASVRGDYPTAERFLKEAVETASKVSDPQLEARALGALSTVLLNENKFDESDDAANREMSISSAASEDNWYADGAQRLAEVAIAKNDPKQGELLQRSVGLAMKIGNKRVVGDAEVSLAYFLCRTGDPVKGLAAARGAHDAYIGYKGSDDMGTAVQLIVLGETQTGDFQNALKDAQQMLAAAERLHSIPDIETAEDEIGDVYNAMGQPPSALEHYQRASEIARKNGVGVTVTSLSTAYGLERLGRLSQAESIFRAVPASAKKDPDSAQLYQQVQAFADFNRGRYAAALTSARDSQSQFSTADMELLIPLTELHLGRKAESIKEADAELTQSQKQGNPYKVALLELTDAIVSLSAGSAAKANNLAEYAAKYFRERNLHSFEWISLVYESKALKALNNGAESLAKAKDAKESFEQERQSWSPGDFELYEALPDIRRSILDLEAILGLHLIP